MRIKITLKKSLEENAAEYFDKAKKSKKKIDGALKAIKMAEEGKEKIETENDKQNTERQEQTKTSVKKEWYHNFRWFYSSEGFLVVGGRDATTNEIIIKKHADKGDIVFHTDMSGSPFFVVKHDSVKEKEIKEDGIEKDNEDRKIGDVTLKETGDATCTFSRAWKLGLSNSSVFYVNPDQVSKTPQSGEYLQKGSFIIRGKTKYIDNNINLALGLKDDSGEVMAAPLSAVKKWCSKFIVIEPGDKKPSEIAKLFKKKTGYSNIDDIIRVLPAGGFKVKS